MMIRSMDRESRHPAIVGVKPTTRPRQPAAYELARAKGGGRTGTCESAKHGCPMDTSTGRTRVHRPVRRIQESCTGKGRNVRSFTRPSLPTNVSTDHLEEAFVENQEIFTLGADGADRVEDSSTT